MRNARQQRVATMRLDITVYSLLFAGGLGMAYWASLPAAESDPNKVSVIAVDPKNVVELTLTGGEASVTAVRRTGDNKFWITYSKAPVAKPDGTAGDPAAALNERFLSGEKIKDILDGLNPLEAQRAIGKLEDSQAEEFGLKDSKEKFTVKTTSGKSLSLVVGKQSYGSRNRFVRDEKDGRVLLINGDIISDLSKANVRLYERGLLSNPIEEATKAEAKAGTKAKKFDHSKKDATGNRIWAEDVENATANASYKSWFDKLDRLRLMSYATDEQAASLDKEVPFLTVSIAKDEKSSDSLAFARTTSGDKTEYWVKSSFLGSWAKLAENRMEPIEKDIPSILGN